MKFTISKKHKFVEFTQTLKNVLLEVPIYITAEGVKIYSLNASNTIFIHMNMLKDEFIDYQVSESVAFKVSAEYLALAVSKPKSDIYFEYKNGTFYIHNGKLTEIRVMDAEFVEKLPNFPVETETNVKMSDFKELMKQQTADCEFIELVSRGNELRTIQGNQTVKFNDSLTIEDTLKEVRIKMTSELVKRAIDKLPFEEVRLKLFDGILQIYYKEESFNCQIVIAGREEK